MSYHDQSWSAEARAELRARIAQFSEAALRELLEAALAESNPDHVLAVLRGVADGIALRQARESTTTTAPCPVCHTPRDLSSMTSGSICWCHGCGAWLRVHFDDHGGATLTPTEAPATWPRETRRKGEPS